MKTSPIIIHPFLFSLLPILFLFQDNIHEIPFEDISLLLMFSGTIAVIIWLILRRFLGGQKSGLIISLLVVLWMAFAHLRLFFGDDDYKNIHFLGSNLVLIPIFTPVGLFGIIYIIKKKL